MPRDRDANRAMLESPAVDIASTISVVDFRRQGMVLQWHSLGGTWTACDQPPALVHGIALIRPAQANVCVYGQHERLWLQIGPSHYSLSEGSLQISCTRGLASFGFRRRFSVKSGTGGLLFTHAYWTDQGRDFFRWLAEKNTDADWRIACGRDWSKGLSQSAMRSA